jgi:hypothetical protein
MVGEQLLGKHFIAREQHAARVAAGVRLVHELEKSDDVLIVSHDPIELLE